MRTTRQKFNLILTLAAMLMMAQTAWAATVKETRTTTWQMDGGASGSTTLENSLTLLNAEGKRLYYYNTIQDGDNSFSLSTVFGSNTTSLRGNILDNHGELRFTNLEGTVTKVELKNFSLVTSGIQMYVGRDKTNTSTLLHLQGNNSDYDVPSSDNQVCNRSATFEGSIEVSQSNPLKIMFKDDGHDANSQSEFGFAKGYITVTYEVEVEAPDPEDPGHTFSFNASGNTLTATCTETASYHHCSLGNSRTSTLTLTADDVPYSEQFYVASLNLGDFIDETGLAVTNGGIVYRNKSTGVESTNGEFLVGDYTVTATIIISGTSYTLTKDFCILTGFKVNNSYSQFSVSKISALEGDEMTITFTPQMGETLDALTLTGATSGNNIAYTQSGNTYTFNMTAEDVNLNATITYPLNENDFAQSEDTYTIKTAEGWNYFCQRLKVDTELNGFSGKTIELAGDITVTTMAGNYDHSFKGTFDGKGHTLTFNYTANMANCAPFCITNGATIRSLHVTGLIQAGNYAYCGGLVGSANGSLTIENCHVSTRISSTINGEAGHGGIVGYVQYTNYLEDCNITGCVFDGLIYNSNTWNQTYGCGGFIGAMSQYAYVDLTDCLFLHGQYDNNGNKCELYWGYDNDRNSTFFNRSNNYGEGKLTNCFYVGTRGLKQGSPAVESTDAPTNFAHLGAPTDHCFMKTYGRVMFFNNKYYTPTYGDLLETYDYNGMKGYTIECDDKSLGIRDVKTQLWTSYLRYKRAFTNGKPATVMLPFNFTKNDFMLPGSTDHPTGKFYKFVCDTHWLVLNEDNEVTSMKANTPYIYVPGEDTDYWYIENDDNGINIFTEGYGGGTKEVEYGNFVMRGTYTGMSWSAADTKTYILGDYYGDVGYLNLDDIDGGESIRPTECYVLGGNYMALADNADNSDDIEDAAESGEVYDAVTLQGRTLYKDGTWNTLCLPFAVSTASGTLSGDNAKVLVLDGETSNLTDGVLTVNFKAPTGTTIAAGTPFIIKWDAEGEHIVNPVFTGVTIATTTAGEVEFTGGKFTGTFSSVSSTDGLLLDAHNANGGAFHAALSIDVPALDGFEGWYTDATLATAATATIPFAEDGTVKFYAKIAESAPATTYTITDVSGTDAQGTLGFYSDQACSTAIAAAAEGATVYIKVTPNSGYQLGSITTQKTVPSDVAESRRNTPATVEIALGGEVEVTAVDAANGIYKLTMPSSNVTVEATFTPITYSIEYELVGGTVATANPTEYTVESTPITLNNPTLEGYTFGGWTGSNGNTPQTEVTIATSTTGNLNYKAVWYTEAAVRVEWNDKDNHDQLRPASLVATLSDGKEVTLNNGNSWTATVEDLPAFDAENKVIAYTWTTSTVDGYELEIELGDAVTTLTYSHTPTHDFTFATGQTWMTWCGSEEYALPSGLEAYTVSGLSEDGTKVVLAQQESILADTPLLLKGTAGTTYSATYSSTGSATGLASTPIENVLTFYGNPTEATITTGYNYEFGKTYVLYKGAFVLVDSDLGLLAHRCILTLSSAVSARLGISIEGTTSLTPIPISTGKGSWYDLQGRKLSGEPTKHGIYIFKGKKVKR